MSNPARLPGTPGPAKTHTPREVATALTDHLKVKLAEAAIQLHDLRKREVARADKKAGILAKFELCVLCGNADRPGSCTCSLQKFEKVTPPDVSEKIVHKLKDEYGHDKEGKAKAFATAWKIHDEKKSELKTAGNAETAHLKTAKLKTAGAAETDRLKLKNAGTAESVRLGKDDGVDKAEQKFHESSQKDCKTCGAQGVKVRQDGGLVTHGHPGKDKGLCNGVRMIKEELKDDKHAFAAANNPDRPRGTFGQTCTHCGEGISHPRHDKPVKKEEMVANVKTAPEKTLPGAKLPSDSPVKTFEAEGSGGETDKESDPAVKKSEKLQKDAAGSLVGMSKWKPKGSMAEPKMPGMTEAKVNGVHPETAAGLAALKEPHPETVASLAAVKRPPVIPGRPSVAHLSTAVRGHGKPVIPGRKPSAESFPAPTEGARKPIPLASASNATNLAADKKAAGIGFLNNLITRFKGIGNKNWAKVGGTGTRDRTVQAMAALARSENDMEKATVPEVNKELGGFKSIASSPTKMPVGGKVKRMTKADDDKHCKLCGQDISDGKPCGCGFLDEKKTRPKPMTKAEAFGGDNGLGNCLHCRKSEHGGACMPLMKEDTGIAPEPQTGALTNINHNHRIVRYGEFRQGVKK